MKKYSENAYSGKKSGGGAGIWTPDNPDIRIP